jgi:5'-nucleotidase
MKILLTNDDGIYADGLWALYERFSLENDVTVIAPDRERSAVGHGITLHVPLRASQIQINGKGPFFAVSGTPADCIKLGVLELMETKPDMVVSGINPGANVGVNINYSGTVAAAKEAALYGMKAIAVSIQGPCCDDYREAAEFAEMLAKRVTRQGLPRGTFLNVNLPNKPMKSLAGVRICRQGTEFFDEYFKKRIDPRNREYYWHGYDPEPAFEHPDIDGQALFENYISITPIKCDMTDYGVLEELKNWDFENVQGNIEPSGSR